MTTQPPSRVDLIRYVTALLDAHDFLAEQRAERPARLDVTA